MTLNNNLGSTMNDVRRFYGQMVCKDMEKTHRKTTLSKKHPVLKDALF